MSLSAFRSFLYTFARFLGDVQAVRRGRIGQRIVNRVIGRIGGRVMRRLWR